MSLYRTLLLTLCALSAATPALALRPPSTGIQLAWNDRPRDQDRAFRVLSSRLAAPHCFLAPS